MTVELKLRLQEPEKVRSMLRYFDPSNVEKKIEHYEYFKDKKTGNLQILKNSDNKLSHIVCHQTPDKKGFDFTEKEIKSWNIMLANMKKKYNYQVSFTKESREYSVKDISIKFCTIQSIGTFMEIKADVGGERRLFDFIDNFGLNEKDLVKIPYDELILQKLGKRVAKLQVLK